MNGKYAVLITTAFLLESSFIKSQKIYWMHTRWKQYDNSGEFQNMWAVLKNYISKCYDCFRMDISLTIF
jgi:hypothetical protein